MQGPPEMVEGMVMKVMTSCSLRPAKRARKPPMAWMPSWELPAMRIMASETLETLGYPPEGCVVSVASLMKYQFLSSLKCAKVRHRLKVKDSARNTVAPSTITSSPSVSISKRISIVLNINDLRQISALLSSDFLIELEKLILSQVINRIKYSGCGLLKIIF